MSPFSPSWSGLLLALSLPLACAPAGLRGLERAELRLRSDPALELLRRFEQLAHLRREADLYAFVGLFSPACLRSCAGFRALPVDRGGGYRVARWVPRLHQGSLLLDRRLRHGLGDLTRAFASFRQLERLELRPLRLRRFARRALVRARLYAAGIDHLGYRRVDSGLVDLDLVERLGGWHIDAFVLARVHTVRRQEPAYVAEDAARVTRRGGKAGSGAFQRSTAPRTLMMLQGNLGVLRAVGAKVSWRALHGGDERPLFGLQRGTAQVFVVADVDGDARADIFVGASEHGSALWLQRASGKFQRWQGPALRGNIVDGVAADFDGDGWVDLYLVRQGGQAENALLRGRPGGPRDDGFQAARELHVANAGGGGRAVCAGDLDGDGRVDLVLPIEQKPAQLLVARSGGFQRLPFAPFVANTCALADLDGDGRLDLYLGARTPVSGYLFGRPGVGTPHPSLTRRKQAASLWLSRGMPPARWRHAPSLRDAVGWDGRVGFYDHDADGDLDLWRRRQEPLPRAERRWWWQVVGPALRRHIAPSLPAISRSVRRSVPDELWINDGRGNLSAGAFAARLPTVGVGLVADADGDGRLDLLGATSGAAIAGEAGAVASTAAALSWRGGAGDLGETGSTSAVLLRLHGRQPGNRDGLGAEVTVWSGGRRQGRTSGLITGWPGAPPGWIHLGVGEALRIERLEIRWPDGQRERHEDLPVRRRIVLVQGQPPRWKALRGDAQHRPLSRPLASMPVRQPASSASDPFAALLAMPLSTRRGHSRLAQELPPRAVLVLAHKRLPQQLCSLLGQLPAPLFSLGSGPACGRRLQPAKSGALPLSSALLPAVLLLEGGRVAQLWAAGTSSADILRQLRSALSQPAAR